MKAMMAAACLAGAFALTTGLSAQTPSSNETKGETGKQTIWVAGCLRAVPGTQGEFLLAKVPANAAEREAAPTTYRLVSDGKVNLRDHVGARVEVKGERTGPPAIHHESERPDVPSRQGSEEPELKVMSLKQIAGSCEPLPLK